eukprot:CAMPEP_0172667364 /NCGR_PEP_ID=MMETSP1074-20121228/8379_1 /TAXON_ID=2916 /ORGANISM="Ceratium fusus, Strain PA161109" /LENGTH=66 /DNA_ID=CAMNT_0013483855 /DNA_START=422 /DNA_END=622 /DNA_ORIENTATION=-
MCLLMSAALTSANRSTSLSQRVDLPAPQPQSKARASVGFRPSDRIIASFVRWYINQNVPSLKSILA